MVVVKTVLLPTREAAAIPDNYSALMAI